MKLTNQDLENIINALVNYEYNDLSKTIEQEIDSFQLTINKIQKERYARKEKALDNE